MDFNQLLHLRVNCYKGFPFISISLEGNKMGDNVSKFFDENSDLLPFGMVMNAVKEGLDDDNNKPKLTKSKTETLGIYVVNIKDSNTTKAVWKLMISSTNNDTIRAKSDKSSFNIKLYMIGALAVIAFVFCFYKSSDDFNINTKTEKRKRKRKIKKRKSLSKMISESQSFDGSSRKCTKRGKSMSFRLSKRQRSISQVDTTKTENIVANNKNI